MTFPASKIISTLVASWMLVGCLLCSCVNAAVAAATVVPVAVAGEMSDDHACCKTQKPVDPPCHSSSDPNDHSDCATCPAMSAKITPAAADAATAKVLLSPWQFEAAFVQPELALAAAPVSFISTDDRPRSLATPLQMKCALLL